MSSKNKKPRIFTIAAKIIQNYQPPIFELYIRNYPGFTTMEWRYTTDSSDSRPCRVFLHICVTHLPTPKKNNVGTERSPHQPNDNNITQNKGSNFIHHSIIYCEERDKIQKKTIQYIGWFIRNNRLWALYQQKSCNIACPAEITIHIQVPMGFPPLSLLLSLSTILIIIHYSLLHWCNAMGKQGPNSWLLDKNISG